MSESAFTEDYGAGCSFSATLWEGGRASHLTDIETPVPWGEELGHSAHRQWPGLGTSSANSRVCAPGPLVASAGLQELQSMEEILALQGLWHGARLGATKPCSHGGWGGGRRGVVRSPVSAENPGRVCESGKRGKKPAPGGCVHFPSVAGRWMAFPRFHLQCVKSGRFHWKAAERKLCFSSLASQHSLKGETRVAWGRKKIGTLVLGTCKKIPLPPKKFIFFIQRIKL